MLFTKKTEKIPKKALEAGHKILEHITDKDGNISVEHRKEAHFMINVVTWIDDDKYRNELTAVCTGNNIRIASQ